MDTKIGSDKLCPFNMFSSCMEHRCKLWVKEGNMCSIFSLARNIGFLTDIEWVAYNKSDPTMLDMTDDSECEGCTES